MASIPMVLHRIRRARRESADQSRFDRYRDEYRQVLTAAEALAGEEALDDIAAWAVDWTLREGHLPPPATLRAETRTILESRGIEIPDDSSLAA